MGMADKIKERRLAMGYTQEELAEKLGLQKSAIAKYENGRVENIKRSVISKMAEVLECSPSYLLNFTDVIEYEPVDQYDYKSLKIIFDRFGYELKPLFQNDSYTLQHKKQKDFIIIVSAYELNTMLLDIGDYVSELISKRFLTMINATMNTRELNAAHERTDISVSESDIKHDDDIMNDDNF